MVNATNCRARVSERRRGPDCSRRSGCRAGRATPAARPPSARLRAALPHATVRPSRSTSVIACGLSALIWASWDKHRGAQRAGDDRHGLAGGRARRAGRHGEARQAGGRRVDVVVLRARSDRRTDEAAGPAGEVADRDPLGDSDPNRGRVADAHLAPTRRRAAPRPACGPRPDRAESAAYPDPIAAAVRTWTAVSVRVPVTVIVRAPSSGLNATTHTATKTKTPPPHMTTIGELSRGAGEGERRPARCSRGHDEPARSPSRSRISAHKQVDVADAHRDDDVTGSDERRDARRHCGETGLVDDPLGRQARSGR